MTATRTSIPAVTGVLYTLSWAAGLAVWTANVKVNAGGGEVIAGYAGHRAAATAQYLLTEGLPAAGLAVIAVALRHRVATIAGILAAVLSFTQFVLGVLLTQWAVPDGDAGRAHVLFEAVNRLDGVKMFALAVFAVAGGSVLSRWLRWTGIALAIAIVISGIGYLLLIPALATVAYVSGVLLLVFVTGTGIALTRKAR